MNDVVDVTTGELIPAALNDSERAELADNEARIERGLKVFYEVGGALLDIRDKRLYRETHKTFEDYCQQRWGMTPQHAGRLISAANITRNLEPIGSIPANEAQVRPLAPLSPDEQRAVWDVVRKTAPTGKVTAEHVKSVVSVFKDVIRTGAIDNGEGQDIAVADVVTAAITEETYERMLRQQAVVQEKLGRKQIEQDERRKARMEAAAALPQLADYVRGDCLDVLKTLPPKSVRLLLTDPPYGMDFQSNRRTVSPQAPKIEGDGDIDGALSLLRAMLDAIAPAMLDECHLLVFTGWRYEPQFRDVLTAAGYSIDASLIWVKENHTSGDLTGFAPKHERILHARRGRLAISPRVPDVLMVAREGRTEHPTEKPVELLKTLIGCTTVEGEFVVDPFAGTGSVVTAARALKRRVLGIEKDDSWHAEGALMLGAAQ